MRVFAVCGPIGSSIKSFSEQFASKVKSKVTIIDEADYLKKDKSVDYDRLKEAVHSQAGIVIVTGHFLFMDNELRKGFDTKIFVQTDGDTCLSNYLKNTPSSNLEETLKFFIDEIKPKNDEEINSSCKHADIVVPEKNINGIAITLLLSSVDGQKLDVDSNHRNGRSFFSS